MEVLREEMQLNTQVLIRLVEKLVHYALHRCSYSEGDAGRGFSGTNQKLRIIGIRNWLVPSDVS